MAKYQVTAPCITHVPVAEAAGTMLNTFYQGAILPADVPADRIKHLLDGNMIEEIKGAEPVEPVEQEADKTPPPGGQGVNSRSPKGDLVEHGVAQGDDRAELEKLTRDDLLAKYVRQQ